MTKDAVLVIERQDAVVEQVGRRDRRLPIVELGEGNLGIGVDVGLLVDASDAFERTDVKGVLSSTIAGALGLELSLCLLIGLGLLECDERSRQGTPPAKREGVSAESGFR